MKGKNNEIGERRAEEKKEIQQILEKAKANLKLNTLAQLAGAFSEEFLKAKEELRIAKDGKEEIVNEIENIENIYYKIIEQRDELLKTLTN